jgi:ribosomal-protein-alanine N-acetyltransferase
VGEDRPRGETDSGDVILRAMRQSDIPEVVYIENRSFRVPWSKRTFKSLLRQPHAALFVAETGESVVGYAAIWFVADEAELGDLAVHPDHRGRGIGSRLLTTSLEEARRRSIRAVFLEVRAGNEHAKRLYERSGFEVVNVRRGYYAQPVEDALVMRYLIDAGAR